MIRIVGEILLAGLTGGGMIGWALVRYLDYRTRGRRR